MKFIALATIFFSVAVAYIHPTLCGGYRVPTYETYATHCLQQLAKKAGIIRSYSNSFCSCSAANIVDDNAKSEVMECAQQGYSIAVWSDDNCGGGCHKTLCRCGMIRYNCEGILPPRKTKRGIDASHQKLID